MCPWDPSGSHWFDNPYTWLTQLQLRIQPLTTQCQPADAQLLTFECANESLWADRARPAPSLWYFGKSRNTMATPGRKLYSRLLRWCSLGAFFASALSEHTSEVILDPSMIHSHLFMIYYALLCFDSGLFRRGLWENYGRRKRGNLKEWMSYYLSKPLRKDSWSMDKLYNPWYNDWSNNDCPLKAILMSTLQNYCSHLWQWTVTVAIRQVKNWKKKSYYEGRPVHTYSTACKLALTSGSFPALYCYAPIKWCYMNWQHARYQPMRWQCDALYAVVVSCKKQHVSYGCCLQWRYIQSCAGSCLCVLSQSADLAHYAVKGSGWKWRNVLSVLYSSSDALYFSSALPSLK